MLVEKERSMKNKFIKFVSGIALSAMILTACATAPKNAMVKIGEKYITEDQIQKEYDRVIASYSDDQKAKYDESTEEGKKAIEKGITEVVFDRSGYLYHGKVKELADGAREAGLKF